MDKLNRDTDGSNLNIVQDNIDKLKTLFPDSFTEGKKVIPSMFAFPCSQ